MAEPERTFTAYEVQAALMAVIRVEREQAEKRLRLVIAEARDQIRRSERFTEIGNG